VRERKPPFSPDDVVKDYAALLKSYRVYRVRGDRYAAQWPVERFSVHGITYEASQKSASDLYLEFLPLLNAGRVELLDNKALVSQLSALERRTSRTGRDTISHPPQGHDDVANAVAGAFGSLRPASTGKLVVMSWSEAFAHDDNSQETWDWKYQTGRLKGHELVSYLIGKEQQKSVQ
jgi:hypothetical protein